MPVDLAITTLTNLDFLTLNSLVEDVKAFDDFVVF